MSEWQSLIDFLEPVSLFQLSNDQGYKDGQIGHLLKAHEDEFPDLTEVDMVLVGCNETRGSWQLLNERSAADTVRSHFYATYHWHTDVQLADIGNIKQGATLQDTYAALRTVVYELIAAGKFVIILGGSHDLTLAQYYAYVDRKKTIHAVGVDALLDLDLDSRNRNEYFLMEMLTGEPNFIKHYSHIGFQSYFVHPRMLETMDRLRFDCFRVGTVKEALNEMEPVIRNSSMLSFDIASMAHAYAPSTHVSPNGFTGEEACTLMRYAGMSIEMSSVGIYGYIPEHDKDDMTARQISHMLWYLMDGKSRAKKEAPLEERDSYLEYNTSFNEVATLFLKSKRSGRWWMQMPDGHFIPCSHSDYLAVCNNELPERWLRAQERE